MRTYTIIRGNAEGWTVNASEEGYAKREMHIPDDALMLEFVRGITTEDGPCTIQIGKNGSLRQETAGVVP